jgi:hypothetical protein
MPNICFLLHAAFIIRDENENDNLRFSEIVFEFFPIFMPKRK